MTYNFRHEAMHEIAERAVLARIIRERKSGARRLDSRMVALLYEAASEEEWDDMLETERDFALAAIAAHQG